MIAKNQTFSKILNNKIETVQIAAGNLTAELPSDVGVAAEAAIQNVIQAANQVGTLMSEISSATQEQSLGIGQISQAVNEMDHTVQHNAMQVQEFAQAVRNLKAQTEFLTHAVAAFRSRSQGQELAIEVDA